MSNNHIQKLSWTVSFDIYDSQEFLPNDEKDLIQRAREAMQFAYVPYSQYSVGCALRLKNGEVITGSNQENASYGLTVCGERSALFRLGSTGNQKNLKKLAVIGRPRQCINKAVALENESLGGPCGACRQVIKEYEDLSGGNIIILCVLNTDRVYRAIGIETLLPWGFGPKNLSTLA